MNEKIVKLQHRIEKKLDAYRYEHTLGVMYTAGALAMRYDVDLDKALLAGLLHDCAKCYPDEKKFELCEKYNVELSDVERVNLAEVMTGDNGAERVKNYSVPMAEGLTFNYGAKQVDDKVLDIVHHRIAIFQ